MNKFLILARPTKSLPKGGVNLQGAIDHLEGLRKKGKADVYTIIEDDGYGFAFVLDVESNEELFLELTKNPLGLWANYQVYALGSLDGEIRALEAVGLEFEG